MNLYLNYHPEHSLMVFSIIICYQLIFEYSNQLDQLRHNLENGLKDACDSLKVSNL